MKLNRRDFLVGGAAIAAGSLVTTPFFLPKYHSRRSTGRSRVAVMNVERYSNRLDQVLQEGLQQFAIDVCGKRVVLKPNLVDYLPGDAINTHPRVVLAAAEAFRRAGAASVTVAEGPGHQRDTQLVLAESGYESLLREERSALSI